MVDFSKESLESLIAPGGHVCSCGRIHKIKMDYIKIGHHAVTHVPEALKAMNCGYPFIVCDINTEKAAWELVKALLESANIPYIFYCFPMEHVEPDEMAVGALTMAFDPVCDCIIGIGSGVVNDCCKVLSHAVGKKQMIIGTAPSMDGYASNSASMIQNRIKVSLYTGAPDAIVCDTSIMKNAPMRMLHAGLGDMLAKYIAQCEWRISNLVTGEYYCENIANLMRESVKRVVNSADGMKTRDEASIQAIVEGLILSGIAMSFAGISRPASGLEHYFSHIWEMMALDRGTPYELHGIQVGIGTLITLQLYDQIRKIKPDRGLATEFMTHFNEEKWEKMIYSIFGKAADTVIMQEHTIFHKNAPERQAMHFNKIEKHWEDILRIIEEELPPTQTIYELMQCLHMPMVPEDINVTKEDAEKAFIGSREIRDKYLTSSMLWDMGLLYEMKLF